MASDNPRARVAELRERWEADRSSRLFLQLAEEYRRQGLAREAIPILEEGLRHHPSSGAGRVALGRCQLEAGDAQRAREILEGVVRRDPTQMVAYRCLVDAYLELEEPEQARDRLALYAQLNPQDPEIDRLADRIARIDNPPSVAPESKAAPLPPPPPALPPVPTPSPLALSQSPLASGWMAPSPLSPPPWGSGSRPGVEPTRAELEAAGALPAEVAGAGSEATTPAERPLLPEAASWAATSAVDPGPDPGSSEPESLEPENPELENPELASLGPATEPAKSESEGSRSRDSRIDRPSGPADQDRSPRAPVESSGHLWREMPPTSEDGPAPSVPSERAAAARVAVLDGTTGLLGSELLDPARLAPPPRLATLFARPLSRPQDDQDAPSVDDAAGAAPVASFVAATTSRSSTATLASLYLRQGHPREAKEIFERVLERQPDDEAAQLGLAQTTAPAIPVPAGHSSRQVSSLRRLDARDLLAGIDPAAVGPGSSDLTSKRLLVLRQYLSRLRGTDRRQHAS